MFFSVKDHDIHHNEVTSNFGQYIMFWDYIFQSRKHEKKLMYLEK